MKTLIRYGVAAASVGVLGGLAACDFKVVNPGPVAAATLDNRASAAAVTSFAVASMFWKRGDRARPPALR